LQGARHIFDQGLPFNPPSGGPQERQSLSSGRSYGTDGSPSPPLPKEDPHRVAQVNQGLRGPTVPSFWAYNPTFAQVQNEHIFMTGWTGIIQGGMVPQAAAEKALNRVAEIFVKYPITSS
jgi:hypothetical protein